MTQGVLLLHGFTGTPSCLESLAAPLRKAGFVVEAPLLAGHGTSAFDLEKTTRRDWYRSAVEAYLELRKKTDRIFVAGLSLGGLLTLKLASEYPIDKIAVLATPLLFTGFTMEKMLPFVAQSFLRHIYRFQPKFGGPAIKDPVGKKEFENYFLMPIASVMEIIRLQQEVRPDLYKIKAPTLIVHSPHDTTAPFESMAYLREHLGSKVIKIMLPENSDHVLTLDYDKDLVAREVVSFFSMVS